MKFEILNRFRGEVQITADIDCAESALPSIKLGLAVKWAIKENADLRYADLRYADLSYADLRSADLSYADLRYADLRSADLRSADLRSADLRSADLRSADLSSAKNAELAVAMTRILPQGELIGWKKCRGDIIVKLKIPTEAKRSHAFGRKCRAEFADVLEVIGEGKAISLHDGKTEYEVGKRMTPDKFDENWMEECSSGIHFFITEEEARSYS